MFRSIMVAVAGAAFLSAGAAYAGDHCSSKGKGNWNSGQQQYRQPYFSQHLQAKPVCIKPVHVQPQTYCYFTLYYKLPCWDYQKEMTFHDLGEAKHMAQLFYDNGYKVALAKFESYGQDKFGSGYPSGKLNTNNSHAQILFQAEGKSGKTGGLALNSQLLESPLTFDGIE